MVYQHPFGNSCGAGGKDCIQRICIQCRLPDVCKRFLRYLLLLHKLLIRIQGSAVKLQIRFFSLRHTLQYHDGLKRLKNQFNSMSGQCKIHRHVKVTACHNAKKQFYRAYIPVNQHCNRTVFKAAAIYNIRSNTFYILQKLAVRYALLLICKSGFLRHILCRGIQPFQYVDCHSFLHCYHYHSAAS